MFSSTRDSFLFYLPTCIHVKVGVKLLRQTRMRARIGCMLE